MIAEFSINPMDSTHISRDLASLVDILEESGLNYRLGPMGTCVEGPWDEVMALIGRCHRAMAGRHERVTTSILIDDGKILPHSMADRVRSVEGHLSSRAPAADTSSRQWTGEL